MKEKSKDNKKIDYPFNPFPKYALTFIYSLKLTQSAERVLGVLLEKTLDYKQNMELKETIASINYIAFRAAIAPETVCRGIKTLTDKKLIEISSVKNPREKANPINKYSLINFFARLEEFNEITKFKLNSGTDY